MTILDEYYLHDFPDRAIRKLLEHRSNLRDLVTAVAPDLAASFDFEHAEPVQPREFVLEDWRTRESDLLFRVPLRDHPELQGVSHLTLKDSFRCLRLALWDEDKRRPVAFRDARPWAGGYATCRQSAWSSLGKKRSEVVYASEISR